VDARGWGLRYPGRAAWAVRNVDLRIEHGERVLLLGPSGGGKSSLLLAIAGLHDRATGAIEEGTLTVDGRAPRDASDDVGILFQDPEAQIVMGRAGDDVAFGLEEHCVPTEQIAPRVERALREVAFPYGPERRTAALSGGEKQRLALAAMLALRRRILLLDEPTAELDREGTAALYAALARLGRDVTIVLVEHRIREALPLVDRVVAIDGERGVIADGAPADVFARASGALERAGIWTPDARPPVLSPSGKGRTLIAARAAGFRYPGASADAVRGVSVELREGEAVAVEGPNGSGKSTLLLLLAGLLRPTTGTVSAPLLDPDRPEVARWPARVLPSRVAMLFQDPDHQFIAPRVIDDVMLGPLRVGVGADVARARAALLLERLGLGALADANPYTLSGGEKRRLGLAGALAAEPRALVLDEPGYGQDRRTFDEVVRVLGEQRQRGAAIAFSTHDPPLTAALADRTFALT
jgi:energy-coupling factor transport system ATP-binding protein